MAYVDLNPIRAGIVQELQTALYTSIRKRLDDLPLKPELLTQPILSMAGKSIVHPNKAKMRAHINMLLSVMNLQPDNWLTQVQNFNKGSPHSIGCLAKLQDKALALKKKWIKGISASKKLYIQA
jgi:hypothetical protein